MSSILGMYLFISFTKPFIQASFPQKSECELELFFEIFEDRLLFSKLKTTLGILASPDPYCGIIIIVTASQTQFCLDSFPVLFSFLFLCACFEFLNFEH